MRLYLSGEGKLNENIRKKLSEYSFEIIPVESIEDIDRNSFLIVVSDFFDKAKEVRIAKQCAKRKITYLRANLLFDEAYIGPLYEPGCACISCVLHAMERNKSELDLAVFSKADIGSMKEYVQNNIDYSDEFLQTAADVIKKIVDEKLGRHKNNVNELCVIKENPLQISCHHVEPEEYCEACYHMKRDTMKAATLKFQKVYKKNPRNYRQNAMPEFEILKKLLVDKDTGKVKHIFKDFASKYIPFTGAELYCGEKIDLGYGRDFDYETSATCGILEAMERYSGMYNKKTDSKIYGSYEELKDKAVNPETLGLHDKSQYNMKGYMYKPYSRDLKYYWVWAWSLKNNKPVLIPEQMAYYAPELTRTKTNRFVYETSNGCALGSTIEEAFIYGLFETIERDNFLVAWYNRLPLTEIDVERSGLEDVIQLKTYIQSQGYEIHFFDMSMELKVPSVWGMIINPDEDAIVKTYSAAGAHFNPETALRGALLEIITSISIYEKKYQDSELQRRREKMYRDDSEVTEFEDHVLLYSHSEAVERLEYLLNENRPIKTLMELYPEWYESNSFQHETLNEDIDEITGRIFNYYDDIYIVDSTGDLLKKCNLSSCKVLIPGMNTMSFGHQYRRMQVDRVRNGPVLAGRTDDPIDIENINTLPHPFP